MSLFKGLALPLYFIYFLALLVGYPEQRLTSPTEIRITEAKIQFHWEMGVLQRFWMQYRALDTFHEPLLEGDAKPEKIFRHLNRSLIQEGFLLGLNFFWLSLLGLCLFTRRFAHFLLNPFSTLLLTSSLAYLFVIFGFYYFPEWQENSFTFGHISVKLLVEICLLGTGISALLLQFFTVRQKQNDEEIKEKKTSYLQMVMQRLALLSTKASGLFQFLLHFMVICIIAVGLANFLLFPLYILQLSFPRLFAFFLVGVLLFSIGYYSYAYWCMLRSREAKTRFSVGLALLGYRLLQSTIFMASILLMLTLLIGSIIVLTIYNVGLLRLPL